MRMLSDNMANNYVPSNAKLFSCLIILTQSVLCTAPRYFLVVLRCEGNETATRCAKPKNCNTCELQGNCDYRCKVDCDCISGYYRNKFGRCISASECPVLCPQNERYSNCVNPCNNCQIRGKCNFLVCNKGCDCFPGYHRDSNGKCIPANTCPVNTPTCGMNEIYNECGTACPATCSRNKPQGCTEQCVKGCFCKDGFVRNNQGECVQPENCPQECGLNEEIVKCAKPKTCNTCEIRGNCSLKRCIEGCDCISGFYRNKSGICIPVSQCPRNCRKDEVYEECGTACPNTCSNLGSNRVCTLQCVPGCFCRDGLVRNESNKCVKPEECPRGTCGANEIYEECGTACPPTCSNLGQNRACTLQCVPGCFCRDGLIRNELNQCVRPEECLPEPVRTCGPGEKYYDCVPTCKDTCENYNDEHSICSRICLNGCACREGLVKRKDGKCVLPELCELPPRTCGINEEYLECGSACPPTCSTIGKNQVCSSQCVQGCFCRKGFVRNASNACVKIDQCPQAPSEECPKNQKYYKCIPSCRRTCMTYNSIEAYCKKDCIPGCFCKDHLVMNKYGECVRPEECPGKGCGLMEQYYECMPDCQNRCNPPDSCTHASSCRPGCFCRPGLVLRDDGKCVRKKFCGMEEHPNCAPDQQYYDCIPSCGTTCKTYKEGGGICHGLCRAGCFCKTGLVLNDENVCIPPEQCPEIGTCGDNEVYKECGTACPVTCSSLGASNQACTSQCVPGCFCRDGLIRNELNECVRPEECRPECPINQEHYDCIPDCGNICETYGKKNIACTDICRPGCFCKSGYVMNNQGVCVRPDECPTSRTCGENEVYKECGTPCPVTCSSLGASNQACTLQCVPGCFCRDGLIRNELNECVRPEECRPECRETEQYYDCIPYCKNTCDTYGKNIACKMPCKSGCFCKPGLVLNDENLCVPPEQCPNAGVCPDDTEQYYECTPSCKNNCKNYNNPGIRCGCGPPGCYCKQGLVKRERDGRCVLPKECNQENQVCGLNEKYYSCMPTCNNTCEDYNKTLLCPLYCLSGCACKEGFVRRRDGKCVRPHQCEYQSGSTETSQSSSTSTSSSTWSEGYQKESGEQMYQANTGSSVWTGVYKEDNERGSQSGSKSSAWSGANQDEERSSQSNSKSSAWSGAYQTDDERSSQSGSESSEWSGAHQTGEAYTSHSNHRSSAWTGEYEKDDEYMSESNSRSSAWAQEYQEAENEKQISQSNIGSYESSKLYQEGGQTSQSSSKSSAWSQGYQEENGRQYSQSSSRSSASSGVYPEDDEIDSQSYSKSSAWSGEYLTDDESGSQSSSESSAWSGTHQTAGSGKQTYQSGWFRSSQGAENSNQDYESNRRSSTWSEFYEEDDSSSSEEESDNWMGNSYDGFYRNDISPDDMTGTKYNTEDSFWDTESSESEAENSQSQNEREFEFQRFSDESTE